jgi:hypothetical protein
MDARAAGYMEVFMPVLTSDRPTPKRGATVTGNAREEPP